MANTQKFMKEVRKLLKTKRTPRASDVFWDVQLGFIYTLEPFLFAGTGCNAVGVCMYPVDKEWIVNLCFAPYYSKRVELNKYDHLSPRLHAEMTPRHRRARVFDS